jgi:hypothetical protein
MAINRSAQTWPDTETYTLASDCTGAGTCTLTVPRHPSEPFPAWALRAADYYLRCEPDSERDRRTR